MTYTLRCGDALDILPTIPSGSIDAVITDPPYPMIKRDYGMLTEDEWWALMMGVCSEVRRVLKPTGSAVFILQPNSRTPGSVRPWLWRFMWWVASEWNMIQDAYWWNTCALPVGGAITHGLMRSSVKPCIWAGQKDCYRSQMEILWHESARNAELRMSGETGTKIYPSGRRVNIEKTRGAAVERGGVTPFNVLPVPNSDSANGSGSYGHGAGTPLKLADWWTRYIVPSGGTVLDCFNGAGTMGVAAVQNGCDYIGIEKMPQYIEASHARISQVQPALVEAAD